MMCKPTLINPDDFQRIQQLRMDEIAFPKINYQHHEPLNLAKTTLNAAYTTISNRVDPGFLTDLVWNNNGDLQWQNNMLQHLSESIYGMIEEYQREPDNQLLKKIFIRINLWGGNSGRGVFVRGERWPQNFVLQTYIDAVTQIQNHQYVEALNTLNQLYGVSTAFSTKHIHFWSSADAPIYDSIIAAVVFGRNRRNVRPNEYPLYICALDALILELGNNEVTRSSIERTLFNWADTPQGVTWRNLRLN